MKHCFNYAQPSSPKSRQNTGFSPPAWEGLGRLLSAAGRNRVSSGSYHLLPSISNFLWCVIFQVCNDTLLCTYKIMPTLPGRRQWLRTEVHRCRDRTQASSAASPALVGVALTGVMPLASTCSGRCVYSRMAVQQRAPWPFGTGRRASEDLPLGDLARK